MKRVNFLLAVAAVVLVAACGQKTDDSAAAEAEVESLQSRVDSLNDVLEAAQATVDSITNAEFEDEAARQAALDAANDRLAEIKSRAENEKQNLDATVEKYRGEGIEVATNAGQGVLEEGEEAAGSLVDEAKEDVNEAAQNVKDNVNEAAQNAKDKVDESIDETADKAADKVKEGVSNLLNK